MATAVTLKESDGTEIYPVTDISLVNGGIHADTIAPATSVAPITAGMIDFSTMYVSAPDLSSSYVSIASGGSILQTMTLPVGKWRVIASFRLSCGGMTAGQTKFFYCGFKYGSTISGTTIQQIPTNMTADTGNSGRQLVTMVCREITATSPYTISSYVDGGELPTGDIKVYKDPGVYMFAIRVG